MEVVSSTTDLLNVVQRAGEGNLLQVEQYLTRHPHSEDGGETEGQPD